MELQLKKRSSKILIILVIFSSSFILRLWNLNQMGRTWDEPSYVEVGYKFIKLIEKGEIKNNLFLKWADEPPLARYIYGLASVSNEKEINTNGNILFNYDYTYPRLASAFISSFSVIVIILIGWEFISYSVGIFSGIILSMLPLFVGYSQLATLESILFFTFTVSVYSFLRFLKSNTYLYSVISGVFLGLAVLSKFTNVLLIPLFIIIFLVWRKYLEEKNIKVFGKVIVILIVSILTFISLWPMLLFNFNQIIISSFNLRSSLGKNPSIEVFFGRLMHVPIFYYFVFFLITTPILILIFFLIGSRYIINYGDISNKIKNSKRKAELKWIYYSLMIWFLVPFIQSFYNFRQHGIRYIVEIYAPLSIIAGIGINESIGRISSKVVFRILIVLLLIVYLISNLLKIAPYYLDYFNVLVGGTKAVYEKKLFLLGWWGQGVREAGYYLKKQAPRGSRIGLAISPIHVFPQSDDYRIYEYNPKDNYDYVVVSYFHIFREGFNDSKIKSNYNLVYSVKADGAILMWIYKSK